MRTHQFASIVLVLAYCACNSSSPVVADASTTDATTDVMTDAGPDALTILPYPAGPYGASVGETMPSFDILGYPLSRTQRDYTQVPFRPVSLAEVRSDPSCTCMVVIWTASNCPWGLMEDTTFSTAMGLDPGLCAAEVIAFNIDSGIDGPSIPAPTRADLEDWVSANRQSYPVGLVTDSALTAMAIGTIPDEPVNWVIRTSDMKIVGMMDGVSSDLGTQARAFCNAPHPGVETLASGLAPTALQIDDAYAYVHDPTGIVRVPLAGGAPQVVVAPSITPGAFTLDATNVYFAAGSSGAFTLQQVSKSGGTPTLLESQASSYDSVAVDSSFVYAARSDGFIERIPIGGGAATILLSGEQHPSSLGIDDKNVYFISQDTNELALVAKSGGQRISGLPPGGEVSPGGTYLPTNLVMGQGEMFTTGRVSVSESSFYIPAEVQGGIMELKVGQVPAMTLGGPNPTIAMSPAGLVMSFSCTGLGACTTYPRGSVGYHTDSLLWKTASSGEPGTNAVAGDAAYVYWTIAETSQGKHDGMLRRLAR